MTLLEEHRIQDFPCYANHPLPGTTHVSGMRWVEYPDAALFCQVGIHGVIIDFQGLLKFLAGPNEVGPKVGTNMLCWVSDRDETPQGVDKA